MNALYSISYKMKTIRFLIIVLSIIYVIKSNSIFYIPSNLPPCQNQTENSLNIPRVNKYNSTFNQFEISASPASDIHLISNHSYFESLKTFSLVSYNNFVSVQLESIERLFITATTIKQLHKSIVHQSSEEDLFSLI
jgi:hypothetical protein